MQRLSDEGGRDQSAHTQVRAAKDPGPVQHDHGLGHRGEDVLLPLLCGFQGRSPVLEQQADADGEGGRRSLR